jgi:hypothetical protein
VDAKVALYPSTISFDDAVSLTSRELAGPPPTCRETDACSRTRESSAATGCGECNCAYAVAWRAASEREASDRVTSRRALMRTACLSSVGSDPVQTPRRAARPWCLWSMAVIATAWSGCAGEDSDMAGDGGSAATVACDESAPSEHGREVEQQIWESLAEERGFAVRPPDFFEFVALGCHVDLIGDPPTTVAELGAKSSWIVLGTIADVVPAVESCLDSVHHQVRYVVEVEQTFKGGEKETLLINEFCGHGAKVAGLRNSLPDERLLFLLDGPWPLDPNAPADPQEEMAFGLVYHYLGIVRQTAAGLQFAYPAGRGSAGVLSAYASLRDVGAAAAASN